MANANGKEKHKKTTMELDDKSPYSSPNNSNFKSIPFHLTIAPMIKYIKRKNTNKNNNDQQNVVRLLYILNINSPSIKK